MHKRIPAFAAVYFGWGSLYLAIRFAVESIPPFLMAGTSSLVAGLFLYSIALWRGASAPTSRQWLNALPAALALLVAGNGLVVWAERTVSSSVTALLLATEPAWFVLIDWVVFRGKKPGAGVLSGVLLGFLGVSILVVRSSSEMTSTPLSAVAMVLAAAFFWSWGSLYCRKADLSKSPVMAIAMPVLMGGAFLLALGFFSGEWTSFSFQQVSARSWACLIYITTVSYSLTYIAYIWLLRNTPVASVSTYAYVNPVVAMALGFWIGGEILGPRELAGGAVILSGVFLMLQNSK